MGMDSSDIKNFCESVLYPQVESIQEKAEYLVVNGNLRRIPEVIFDNFICHYHKVQGDMKRDRLDRHKLAACLCISIAQSNVLVEARNKIAPKNRMRFYNLYLAICAALVSMKRFMIMDTYDVDLERELVDDALENFEMAFPDAHRRDTANYETTLLNALNRTINKNLCQDNRCDKYDLWAYATIFYHLENYNMERLTEFKKQQSKTA